MSWQLSFNPFQPPSARQKPSVLQGSIGAPEEGIGIHIPAEPRWCADAQGGFKVHLVCLTGRKNEGHNGRENSQLADLFGEMFDSTKFTYDFLEQL